MNLKGPVTFLTPATNIKKNETPELILRFGSGLRLTGSASDSHKTGSQPLILFLKSIIKKIFEIFLLDFNFGKNKFRWPQIVQF